MRPVCADQSRQMSPKVLTKYRSGEDKEEQEDQPGQVQDPMQAQPLHPHPQGLGPRREAEAESATWYVKSEEGGHICPKQSQSKGWHTDWDI
jgi:hypothetical protein